MATFNNGEAGLSVRTKLNNVMQHADGTPSTLTFNDAGADVDVRMEGVGQTHAFFLDAGTSNIGIGTSTASSKLTVAGDANVAGIATAIAMRDSTNRRITSPGGGSYTTTTASVTGAIAITLPVGYTNHMMKMKISVYEYTTQESFDIIVGGYNYSTGPTWVNCSAAIISNNATDRDYTVRFGFNATSSKCVIYIGELASAWSYPQVNITDVQIGYNTAGLDVWDDGWSVGFEASAFQNVTVTLTNNRVGARLIGTGQTTAALTDAGARGDLLRLSSVGTAAGTGGGIVFTSTQGDTANSLGMAAIKSLLVSGATNTTGDLAFSTRNAATDTNLTERMRITSDGRVGIGMTPSAADVRLAITGNVDIRAGTTENAFLEIGRGRTGDGPSFIDLTGDATYSDYGTRIIRNGGANGTTQVIVRGTGGLDLRTTDAGPIIFNTTATERMRISAAGNVGIGTNNPVYTLDVGGSARFQAGAEVGNLQGLKDYNWILDYNADVANTWKTLVDVSMQNTQYSTLGFKFDVVDYNSNNPGTATADNLDFETYYINCVRANDTVLDTPDTCYVRGPGSRFRAVKTAVGTYEIQMQNDAQYREYRVDSTVYGVNGAHTITYRNGSNANTGIAQYAAANSGGIYQTFLNTVTTGNVAIRAGIGVPTVALQVGVPASTTGALRANSTFVSVDSGFSATDVYGTAALPSLIIGGDLNTGIYHPAADTLAISTNGAERYRFASAGQLGIAGANFGTAGQVFISGGPSASTSWGAVSLTAGVSGTLPLANGGTGVGTAPAAAAVLYGYTATATAAGTTTLTNTSSQYQLFTGTTTQTVVLPVTSTLTTGWTFHIVNASTGNLTVNSSGGNLVATVIPGTTVMVTCILTSGTTAASWEYGYTDFNTLTGTGSVVMSNSPTLTTPTLGTGSFALGAVGTPSITFTGDLNTGIWSPGADIVAASTNGTERIRIDAAGNVSIGVTTTTNARLEVRNTALGGTAGDTSVIGMFAAPDANISSLRVLSYRTATGADHLTSETRIQRRVDSTDMGYIGFATNNTIFGYGTSTEFMRLTNGGLLGIGTSVPADLLHLGTAAPTIRFDDTNVNGIAQIYQANNVLGISIDPGNVDSASRIQFLLDGATTMTLDDVGSVGIGTTANTSAILDVSSTTKGFLPPRMTTTQRDAISSPATGLTVYNTTTSREETYDGAQWIPEIPLDIEEDRIINGGFDVWQRGTSSTTNGYAAADRWINTYLGGTVTQSRQSFTLGDTLGMNSPQFFLRQSVTGQTLASQWAITQQRIEGVRSYAGQTITVLGWAKRATAGNIAVEVEQSFGTGGTPSPTVYASPTTVALTTSWTPFAVTVTLLGIGGKTFGTTAGTDFLGINFWISGGTDFNARTNSLGLQTTDVDFWGIHIREGIWTANDALLYRQKSITAEQLKCFRYYYRVTSGTVSQAVLMRGFNQSTTASRNSIDFPVRMRAIPTALEQSGTAAHYAVLNGATATACTAVPVFQNATEFSALVNTTTGATLVAGQGSMLVSNGVTGAYLGWSAEL